MALPSANTLWSMDYEYYGEPFIGSPAKGGLGMFGLDTEYYGEPYVTNDVAAGAAAAREPKRRIIVIT